jgi:hypothetical protein
MKLLWITSGLLVACQQMSPAQQLVTRAKTAPVPANKSMTSANYVARVRLISQDLRWSLAQLYLSWENYQTLQDLIDRPRKDTDVAATREEQDRTKRQLLGAMKGVEANARRLRGLSPVPRTLKSLDEKLIDAGLELGNGSQAIATWLLFPSNEVKNTAARQLRHAQSTLLDVNSELARRTDANITRKIYSP